MAKGEDYYLILGVPRDESLRGIRAAFRDLAKKHHPDVAGPQGTPTFQRVAEAYRVLSDPATRREHDARLAPPAAARTGSEPIPVRRPRRRAHPLEPRSLLDRRDTQGPSENALLDRFLRNFTGLGVSKSESPERLFCDVHLSRDEAQRGGVLPIRLPAQRPCPGCHGIGRISLSLCTDCGGRGSLDEEIVVPLRVPADVAPGTRLDVSLGAWGIGNLWLRVRFTIT